MRFPYARSVITPDVSDGMLMSSAAPGLSAPASLGGIGIVSTLVALLIVVFIPNTGRRIAGVLGRVLGPVITWPVTASVTSLPTPPLVENVALSRATM